MAGKSRPEREALERQNAALMAVFERAGFDHIAPDIIQPADIFLERSGEDIRARTFVFTDPAGAEMCLRPDLTVPACRYHLSHSADPAAERRYCYLGPAFRFPDERLSPQEFTQAGLEWFGAAQAAAAEARVLKLTISALEVAGLAKYRVTFGDLGLFSALLADTDMPERWRRRLKHHFWRPHAFRDLLDSFCAERTARRTSVSPIVDRIENSNAQAVAEAEIEARNLPLVGGRDLAEIAERLAGKAADRRETPLARAKADSLNAYLAISGEDATAMDREFERIAGARASPPPAPPMRPASSRWRSWASIRAASASRRASAATSNTIRASPSRSRRIRPKARSRWRVAAAMTTCSRTWARQ